MLVKVCFGRIHVVQRGFASPFFSFFFSLQVSFHIVIMNQHALLSLAALEANQLIPSSHSSVHASFLSHEPASSRNLVRFCPIGSAPPNVSAMLVYARFHPHERCGYRWRLSAMFARPETSLPRLGRTPPLFRSKCFRRSVRVRDRLQSPPVSASVAGTASVRVASYSDSRSRRFFST